MRALAHAAAHGPHHPPSRDPLGQLSPRGGAQISEDAEYAKKRRHPKTSPAGGGTCRRAARVRPRGGGTRSA
jgi:hypothetical protein